MDIRTSPHRALRRLQRPRPRPHHGLVRRRLRARDAARQQPVGIALHRPGGGTAGIGGTLCRAARCPDGNAEHFVDEAASTGMTKWLLTGTTSAGDAEKSRAATSTPSGTARWCARTRTGRSWNDPRWLRVETCGRAGLSSATCVAASSRSRNLVTATPAVRTCAGTFHPQAHVRPWAR